MTKLWPEFDAFIEDVKNIWEGDAIENIVQDPDLAEKLEEDFRETGELPTWLDPNVELDEVMDDVAATIVSGVKDFGFGKGDSGGLFSWWPLSLGLTALAAGALVVISR